MKTLTKIDAQKNFDNRYSKLSDKQKILFDKIYDHIKQDKKLASVWIFTQSFILLELGFMYSDGFLEKCLEGIEND